MTRVSHEAAKAEALLVGYEPLEAYPGRTDAKWKAIHVACGREVYVRLTRLRRGEGSCRPCGQKARTDNKTDPALARQRMIDLGFEPLESFPGAVNLGWQSKCLRCGEVSHPSYASIVLAGQGCRFCWRKRLSESKRIGEEKAVEAMLANELRPIEPYPGANNSWRCTCLKCGSTVAPALTSVKLGVGCRQCGYRSAAAKMVTPSEVAIMEIVEAGYEPLEDFRKANDAWGCVHIACGSELSVSLTRIRAGWRPCRKCNPSVKDRFKYDSPAIVYVLHHVRLDAVKIGIAGVTSNRLKMFEKHGWEVFHQKRFESGSAAWYAEQSTLRHIRKTLEYPPYLSADAMKPMTGWTETVCADLLTPYELRKLVESVGRPASTAS